ncbi:MAG: HupE/UreJ family protein [Candidatus Eremiobacteraeota bacterium]|nr:HupE/UreJ family protein [Candidatus Eremiobacteraeota bacterium]
MTRSDTGLRGLRLVAWALVACAAAFAQVARAHEFKLDAVVNAFIKIDQREATLVVRAPLYLFKSAKFPVNNIELDIQKSAPAVARAVAAIQHDITLFENDRPLIASHASGRLSLPSDRSFESYEQASTHVSKPLEPGTSIYVDQGYVDARITYPISSPGSVFALRTTAGPELGEYLKVALRYLPPGGESRAMVITSLSGTVALNPTWLGAAAGFIRLGVAHILTGYDHLLFLLCLVIPLRGWRQILSVITVFTIAHSFTLLGSAFNLAPSGAWFPPFVEMAIAASIVYMALENIMGVKLERRVLITGLFGLVHGFAFSYGLKENFQFAGTHLLASLFGFNIGIELGQILVLAVMLPALAMARRYVLPGRVGMIILSAIVADTGWHWMIDRADVLWKTPWPRPSAAGLALLVLWLAGILLAAGGLSIIAKRLRFAASPKLPPPEDGALAD